MLSKAKFILGMLVIVLAGHGSAICDQVYWTDKKTNIIYRGNRDGSGPHTVLVSGLGEARGLGLDIAGGKMYWSDAGTGKIQRANLDGSDIEDLVTGLPFLADVELDLDAGKVYWSQIGGAPASNAIRRANFDGTGVEDVRAGLNMPYYFDLDTVGGVVYWGEVDNTVIHRMSIDGTGPIDDVVTGLVQVRDVGLDLDAGMIYWGDRETHKIQRKSLAGSGEIEDLHTFIPERGKPHGMALDLDAGMIYWTDTRTHEVMRGRMDGVGTPEVLYGESIGLDDPWDIELDIVPPTPGDTNGDGVVNDADYINLVAQFGGPPGPQSADFNSDGFVGLDDLAVMRANFASGAASSPGVSAATTPEPATLSLLAAGLAGLLAGRKRRRG